MVDGPNTEQVHAPRNPTARTLSFLLAVACESGEQRAIPIRAADAAALDSGDVAPWSVEPFPEALVPLENPMTPEKIELGRLLFYDPIVSTDRQTACVTCHSEVWGMSDALPRSVGHGGGLLAGPGRSGVNRTRRNSMTLWNVAFRSTTFWDGRAASLEDQVHFPFDSADEFDKNLDTVVGELRTIPRYVELFAAAFPDEPEPVSPTTLSRAIAAFERTLVSSHGLYESYLAGDKAAMSERMLRGMALFAEEGCPSCHVPPLFASERFEGRGVEPIVGVDDAGRYEVTGDEMDRNRFKVPTLRNAHDTGPFFHTGAVILPADAVRHEVSYSVEHDGARPLDDAEVSDLTAFIVQALFDSKNSPTRPREVPSGLPVPIDSASVRR
jgi:cytochrome c peroxidase